MVALSALLGFLALGSGIYVAFGHDVITSAHRGESLGMLNEWYAGDGRRGLDSHLERADETFRACLAVGLFLAALSALVYLLFRSRSRLLVTIPSLLAFYLASDFLVGPHLVRTLRLTHFAIVRDPDHRPKVEGSVPGWNSDGLRGSPESSEYLDRDLNLIFLGDSFTYGMRIPDPAQAFPSRVQRMLAERLPEGRVRVANFAWTSSSPFLSYRRLAEIGDRYRPDLVALFVDMTDIHDDVKWEGMVERRGVYWFYDKLPISIKWMQAWAPGLYWRWWSWSNGGLPAERFFHGEAPLAETREHFEAIERNIGEIAAWARERSIPFALFILPRYHQYSDRECPDDRELLLPNRGHSILGPYVNEPFRFFEELGGRVDHPVFSLLEDFRNTGIHPHCYEDDPHWNPAGHAIAAEAVTRDLLPLVRNL